MSDKPSMGASDAALGEPRVYIGCAGWSLRAEHKPEFPAEGSHLNRYAARFHCVEVNSSFYRAHRPSTWERWADSVPDSFRFSFKLPKSITHQQRLVEVEGLVTEFAEEVAALQEKQGPLLVQLPPSLRFDVQIAEPFLRNVTHRFSQVALEPRHPSWFTEEVDALLSALGIGGVAADPPRTGQPPQPYGARRLAYFRLHGSPKIYYSTYSLEFLQRLAESFQQRSDSAIVWCIFDNTAEGHAISNALSLHQLVEN